MIQKYRWFLQSSKLPVLHGSTFSSNQHPVNWKRVKMNSGDSFLKIRPNPIIKRLDTPEFNAIFSPELDVIIKVFKNYNHEIRLAGGPVRDLLQGKVPGDIDIATTATPTEMKEMFTKEGIRMINMNGEKHGTITPRVNETANFEITTLRIDEETDGRHAKVKFTKDWQMDANRRDLTINSMFLDFDGQVYDYFYGYDDLMQRRVAFVGNPVDRIQEDYLRILRYYRFYGRIADKANIHEAITLDAIRENIGGLRNISGERIWMELKKILVGKFGPELLLNLLEQGGGPFIGLPADPQIKEFQRVASGVDMSPITMLVALLKTPEDALKLHERLKLSAFERDLAYFITQNREAMVNATDVLEFQRICFKNQGTPMTLKAFSLELLKYFNKPDLMNALADWKIPQPPLSGQFLKDNNCPDGKVLGRVRQILVEKWIDSRFELSQEELGKFIPDILESLKDFIEDERLQLQQRSVKRKHVSAVKN